MQIWRAGAGNPKPVERSTTQTIHVVKKGETLGKIAQKYKCSVTNLKKWNNLTSNNIKIGQKLKVYPPETNSSSQSGGQSGSNTTYTVKSGDSLWSIAKKYNVSVDYIKKKNNLKSNELKVGQKLKL